VPAFGGLFVDESTDTLYVYMVPHLPGDLATLDQALTAAFGSNRPTEYRIETLPGKYTFRQLKAWDDRMSPEVLATPGVVLTDIDDKKNRLTVGVEDPNLLHAVEAELSILGIPREAVDIEQMSPLEPDLTLQDYHRPVYGGLQIERSAGGTCTLGFFAKDTRGATGFVTNSHCTDVQGGVEGTVFSQPSNIFPLPTVIGTEASDPCYFPSPTCAAPWFSGCPAGQLCRYSDSAFAVAAGVVPGFGKIAHSTGGGSINWDGSSVFVITDQGDLGEVGKTVYKVGSMTGLTSGTITRVCAKVASSDGIHTFLCQTLANYLRAGGDSGSPVFQVTNAVTNEVKLIGIHWGGGPGVAVFSPIGGVEKARELGPLKVCFGGGC
jgi:hypothetical protein